MLTTIILASLAVAAAQGRTDETPAPYTLELLDFHNAKLIDDVCIVRATGKTRERRTTATLVTSGWKMEPHDVSIEHGVVLDGPGKGSTVGLVTFDPPDDPISGNVFGIGICRRPSFMVGRPYLALALSIQEGKLYQPISLDEERYLKEHSYILFADSNELSLLTAFPTEATELPQDTDPATRLAGALVDALPSAHGWDRERLLRFLRDSREFGYDSVGIHEEGPLAHKLREIAERTQDPVLRVDAYSLLVDWQVKGFEGALYTALMDAADSDYTGELANAPYYIPDRMDYPRKYKIEYDRQRCNYLAATAKNETIREYLFQFGVSRPTREDKARYVSMLDVEPRSFVDDVMLRKLADWDRLPDKKPVWAVPAGKSHKEVVDRDKLIAFWKARYRF